jgi:hypothetical protein
VSIRPRPTASRISALRSAQTPVHVAASIVFARPGRRDPGTEEHLQDEGQPGTGDDRLVEQHSRDRPAAAGDPFVRTGRVGVVAERVRAEPGQQLLHAGHSAEITVSR